MVKSRTVRCRGHVSRLEEVISTYTVYVGVPESTGRFLMFSVITNIYNKKTKGLTLMELFTATGKLFFLTRDVRYRAVPSLLFLETCSRVCGNNLNIVSMCAVSPVVHTSNISSCQKKTFFSFPVAVNNSIKVGPLVFLL